MFSDVAYAMASAPQDAGSAQPAGPASFLGSPIVMMILIFVIFYFLLIRPQSKKAKEHRQMLENLKKGDKIITNGGIYGVIEGIEENSLTIKIAENVKIKMGRHAVAGLRTGE